MLYYIHLSGQPDRIKRSIRIELPKVNCSEYKQEGVLCKNRIWLPESDKDRDHLPYFALCMGEYAFGSVVVDEVLIGGQEEQAPVDAAPAAQESAEPDASQPVSEAQTKPESQSTMERQAKTADSYPVSELDTRSATPAPSSKVAGTPRPDTEAPGQEKFATPVSKADGMGTDPGQSKVPAESTASVSANDRQQFHVPNQETQTNGDKTAKSGNSSGKMAVERLRNRKGRHRSSLLSGRTLQRQQAKKNGRR